MKKKVFFIISSLGAGGAERVFWLLSQGFDKNLFDVAIVTLNSNKKCFSTEIEGVKLIELKTEKASLSFLKLYKLFKEENPSTVYSTVEHINILVALVSMFVKVPNLIARASNIPTQIRKYRGKKAKFYNFFTKYFYKRFDKIVCQSVEMEESVRTEYNLKPQKLIVIPNPVVFTRLEKQTLKSSAEKKLIMVARLSAEKGFNRLLDTMSALPANYTLTIVGDGPLRGEITTKISELKLAARVHLLGQKTNVADIIAKHDVFVLSSFTEGFPNVVLEALSVGVPVVTYKVGGISGLVENGFNGYIVEQGDSNDFKSKILTTCSKTWDSEAIRDDVYEKCALDKIADKYESLISY